MAKHKYFIIAALVAAISAAVQLLHHYAIIHVSREVLVTLHFIVYAAFALYAWKRRSLTAWIFVAMIMGIGTGYDFPVLSQDLKVLSDIFLRLIKTIIAPLLFGTLVVGIAGHSNLKQVGRMGVKAIVYFEIITTVALFIGLAAINLTKAGVGIPLPHGGELPEAIAKNATKTVADHILETFPENIAKAVMEGHVLQIVVFSILFGIGLAMVSEAKRKPMLLFAESLSEVMFKFTNIVMYFAPAAVFGALAFAVGKYGLAIFSNLIWLIATLYMALIAFIGVLLLVAVIAKVPIKNFIRAVTEPVTLAFATASSESALPIAMENMEAIGVPRKVVAFVLPTGYSFNLDGTTLYLSLASVFVAQAAGIHLSFGEQLVMVLTLMLTSKGVAGIPRASLVILSATAASFNLPVWPILAIMGVDAIMDMARTAVNVLGNCLASVIVARWEGEYVERPFDEHSKIKQL
jgi:proton glutamate symport protein